MASGRTSFEIVLEQMTALLVKLKDSSLTKNEAVYASCLKVLARNFNSTDREQFEVQVKVHFEVATVKIKENTLTCNDAEYFQNLAAACDM